MGKMRFQTLPLILMLIFLLEAIIHISCHEVRSKDSQPRSDKQSLRSRAGVNNLERERTRLLRRLLQSSFGVERRKKKERQSQRYDWIFTDDVADYNYDAMVGDRRPGSSSASASFRRKASNRKRLGRMEWGYWEDSEGTGPVTEACCPQKTEIISPAFGRNNSGHMVDLYRDSLIHQRFYEVLCEPRVMNKPCRFLEGRNYRLSKCVQKYAYTYALVRSLSSVSGWSLDHIRIRSGCACELFPPDIKRKSTKRRGFN